MEAFKAHIEAYIKSQVSADPMFAEVYNKSERSTDDCINYILNWVSSAKGQVVAKEEIYGQVIHFFTENLDPGAKINAHVVCATNDELTEEEKAAARQQAIQQYQQQELAKLQAKNSQPKAKPEAKKQIEQAPSLFDFDEE